MSADDDRPKRSWKEIDQMRDGSVRRDERRPRGKAAEARSRAATQQYLKEVDKIFAPGGDSGEAEPLAKAVRDAHGTSGLVAACREYVATAGVPRDPDLLAIFLDCGEPELVVQALEALLALRREGHLDEVSKGLRSQLRVLAQDFNDSIAEAAEDLVAEL